MDDVDGEEMPGAIVEPFLEREEGARALLRELERLAVEGRHDEVRERVRDLAQNNESVFYTVAFSLTNSRQFFGDVEAQLDVTAADRLRDVAETFPSLAEPFNIVRTEIAEDRHNPVTDTSYTVTYHHAVESPMVTYRPRSGDVELYESKGTPSELLGVSTDLAAATTDALDVALENDYSVNTEELSALIDRREELETELSKLRDQLDELRRTPVNDE
jgi:predicted nuclease with TOPRIM domain